MGDVIRVLICDDDPLVRAGLSLLLGGHPAIDVVGETGDGLEALAWLERPPDGGSVDGDSVDVVMMDLRMPRLDGIETTRRIQVLAARPKVIVLTTFDADDHVIRALESGADGFLLKDTPPSDIVEAIVKVAAGEPILSPSVTQQLIDRVTSTSDGGRLDVARRLVATLTAREVEVARAIAQGKSNAEIAAELFMSVTTVKAHLTRIFSKLEASNRVRVAITMHEADRI